MEIFSKFDIQIVQGFEGLDGYTFSWLALYDLISLLLCMQIYFGNHVYPSKILQFTPLKTRKREVSLTYFLLGSSGFFLASVIVAPHSNSPTIYRNIHYSIDKYSTRPTKCCTLCWSRYMQTLFLNYTVRYQALNLAVLFQLIQLMSSFKKFIRRKLESLNNIMPRQQY